MKTFMGNWLRDNWGKLLLAVIGALVGIIAATIITGGAILAALPVIMKIVAAIFVGLAIMKAIEYLKTYLSEGWEKKVQPAARALANAVAVGIVELAMALGFRAIGVGLKAVGKAVKAGAKLAVTGVKRAATAAAAGIKSLLKSGAKLVSRSGTTFIRSGKLIFKGLKSGFSKGVKKVKDLVSRLFAKFRFRKFKITLRNRRFTLWGYINPWIKLAEGYTPKKRDEAPTVIRTPREYEDFLEPILRRHGYLSKGEIERMEIRFEEILGIRVPPSERGKLIAVAEVTKRQKLIPDFVNPYTGAIADAKWYHTLRNRFGRELTDKAWYSQPANQLNVKTALSEQLLNYAEAQKQILCQVENLGLLKRLPDPPIRLLFPEEQALWLTTFLDAFPGVKWEIIR
jgi:hypothetical protein